MFENIETFLNENIHGSWATWIVTSILLAGIAIVAVASYYLAKALLWLVERAVKKSPTEWDDDIINKRFTRAVSQLAPALMVSWLLPRFFGDNAEEVRWLDIVTSFYILWAIVRIVLIFIDNLYEGLARRPNTSPYAIKGVFQMFKLIFFGIGVIVGLSILIGKTPLAILGALGAAATVLMLVFKDTILGLVASVQLTANKMVQRGDWISCPGHNANGMVEDVSLTTVKVRNFDNSITTIPPYSLVSESFQNFQAMVESAGRRVSRAFYVDATTVRFCSSAELQALRAEGFLDGVELPADGKIVNLMLLRLYLEQFLRRDPRVNPDLTLMVRQLPPTPTGLPVELYFFTHTTKWVEFEHIQSDIFNHVYATIERFGLRVFQSPSGTDILRISSPSCGVPAATHAE